MQGYAFPSAMRRATESSGPIRASDYAAAGVIGEHHWERLDGGRYGTTGKRMIELILDPSILLSWCKVEDESALDQLFSITRSLCYALHVKRSALLDGIN